MNQCFISKSKEYKVPRGVGFEEELRRLFRACAPCKNENWVEYGLKFKNDVFVIFPYYWGECTCGYQEKEEEWFDTHEHAEKCYQSILKKELDSYDQQHPDEKWEKRRKAHELITKRLCEKMGIVWLDEVSWENYCTCEYREQLDEFFKNNHHHSDCPIVRPNFFYKPTGYELRWYKYPLRDSYANKALTLEQFKRMIDDCIQSLE